MMLRKFYVILLSGVVLAGSQASAQQMSSLNKLGLLKFCQGRGYNDGTPVGRQYRALSDSGMGGADIDGSTDENMGEKGFVTGAGGNTTLGAIATHHNISEQDECDQLAGNSGGTARGGSGFTGGSSPAGTIGNLLQGQIPSGAQGLLGKLTGGH